MPRTSRASAAVYCYHVLNRGNGRGEVFHKAADFASFQAMIGQSKARLPMRVLCYCLMPNHFHLVVRPHGDGDLSRWLQWLLTTHVRRYRRHYGSSVHVWQGRFKAFPCQDDGYLLTVLRYVERNALRAGLVARAQDWPYGSLASRFNPPGPVSLDPVPEADDAASWVVHVNRSMGEAEQARVRNSISRGTPFGSAVWAIERAAELGLESSMRPRGRRGRPTKSRMSPLLCPRAHSGRAMGRADRPPATRREPSSSRSFIARSATSIIS